MKKKILGVLLTVSLISSALGSCGKDVPSDSQDIIVPEITETTEIIETLAPTQATEDDTTEQSTEAKSDFDFAKAVESTYICGQKLSYPLTWGQFGEDFSVDPEGAFTQSGSQKISCSVNYEGQYLGCFIFRGCESVDAITDDTEIANILIQNQDMPNPDDPKISVNGVTLNETRANLYEALGDSYEVSDDGNVSYRDTGSKRQYRFIFSFFEEDKIVTISIFF